MIENIEENSGHPFEVYINQSLAQTSQQHTIHKPNTKRRPYSGAISKKISLHPRQASNLHNQNINPLPLLGHKCKASQSHRLCESQVTQNSHKDEHLIQRIQFCDLMGKQQRHITRCNYKQSTVASKDTVFKWNSAYFGGNKLSKKQKKKGYESQQMRLKASQEHLNKLYSRYDRIDNSLRLSDVIGPLRSQIIRSKASKLLEQFQ